MEAGQFVPVWFDVAAVADGIAIGSAAAAAAAGVAGWLDAGRRRGQHERRGRRSTAERRLPGAEPGPVGGAAAAGPGGEQQAGGRAGGGKMGAMAMR